MEAASLTHARAPCQQEFDFRVCETQRFVTPHIATHPVYAGTTGHANNFRSFQASQIMPKTLSFTSASMAFCRSRTGQSKREGAGRHWEWRDSVRH